jgi:regulator of protease activity HflC (stomatin/prohibitin superfamily)
MKPLKIVGGLLALALVLFLGFMVFFTRVEPYEIGVRLDRWGDGVVQRDFGPGFHLGIPGFHEWHRLDRRTHFVTFADGEHRKRFDMAVSLDRPPLEIRTSDNNPVTVDVSVTYRIRDGSAHRLVAGGLKSSYRDRVTSTMVRVLREELAKLTPADFVNTQVRLARADQTLGELERALSEFHVVPEIVLIRAVRFYESYEAKLQDTQLRQQLYKLETSKQAVEEALARTGRIDMETERLEKEKVGDWDKRLQEVESRQRVAVADILGEARKHDLRTRAQADADYQVLVAEGDFALAEVEALRDELRNAALDTLGGRIYQARAAAANLQFSEVTLNSNDPAVPSVIDLDALVLLLIGSADPGAARAAGR